MAAMSPRPYSVEKKIDGDQVEAEIETEVSAALGPAVTRHIVVKSSPSHSNQALEKAVVLRRIRQRKRVNKLRAAVGALFSSPFTDKTEETHQRKWVDEPFTSL
ncbi:hypothetical protein E6C27_scaffold82G006120 [Cucumis melo var. makuwa]|uniref:Uncharacterized protein n=1 Tax=Cucumis melo var. makuwa TaxID=1194695 RepID=A0A5A7VDJ5_CUCMM|nr:hypothetical protein E6C27_scaffold82G006120 [Cucumis melo var. makuwa]